MYILPQWLWRGTLNFYHIHHRVCSKHDAIKLSNMIGEKTNVISASVHHREWTAAESVRKDQNISNCPWKWIRQRLFQNSDFMHSDFWILFKINFNANKSWKFSWWWKLKILMPSNYQHINFPDITPLCFIEYSVINL